MKSDISHEEESEYLTSKKKIVKKNLQRERETNKMFLIILTHTGRGFLMWLTNKPSD